MMKTLLKKVLPKSFWNLRHLFYAAYGAYKYTFPSKKLFVIGVTGTSGKSSTVFILHQLLESAGFAVGSLSTIEFHIGTDAQLNDKKMTMLGRTAIQKYLRRMVDEGIDIAIVETTSEGRVQHRHRFIEYDLMLLTNLYPEHIDSHGSFKAYKQAKVDIFSYVAKLRRKQTIAMTKKVQECISTPRIQKKALICIDVDHHQPFAHKKFDSITYFGSKPCTFQFTRVGQEAAGLHFSINSTKMHAPLFAAYNAHNITAAVAAASVLGLDEGTLQKAVTTLKPIPGRIEFIEEAEKHGFNIIVDYAFEPVAIKALYEVVHLINPKRVIHVFGSTGGGRDISRRASVGEFVGLNADICIITDEDPYDDDPMEIMEDVAQAVREVGKIDSMDLTIEPDRNKAIALAVAKADIGDIILITGKGSEQAMFVKGKLIPWDDRTAARNALRALQ